MKKIILLLMAIIIIAIILGLGLGFGLGKGSGDGSGDGTAETTQSTAESDESNNDTTSKELPSKEVADKDEGESSTVKISVVENEYFFENERTTLDDFVSNIQDIESVVVEVKDDNASLKAYNKLIDRLDELNIPYKEN